MNWPIEWNRAYLVEWGLRIALAAALFTGLYLMVMVATEPGQSGVRFAAVNYAFDEGGVCPGDAIRYAMTIEISQPTIVNLRAAVYRGLDASGDIAPAGFQQAGFPVPNAVTREDNDPVFIAPNLPPGDYSRVIGIADANRPVKPDFAIIPFRIRADCEVTE